MKEVIPLTFTFVGISLSIAAIVAAGNGSIPLSFGFALLAFGCDILDGFFARRLQVASNAGRIADSCADVPLYLLYPAVVVLHFFGEGILIVALLVFVASGIFRLIRFTRRGFMVNDGALAYEGVPVFFSLPLLGGLIAAHEFGAVPPVALVVFTCLGLSILMVSRVPVSKVTEPRVLIVIIGVIGLAALALLWIR